MIDTEVPTKYKAIQKLASLFSSHHIYYYTKKDFISSKLSMAAADRAEVAKEQIYLKELSTGNLHPYLDCKQHSPSIGSNYSLMIWLQQLEALLPPADHIARGPISQNKSLSFQCPVTQAAILLTQTSKCTQHCHQVFCQTSHSRAPGGTAGDSNLFRHLLSIR